MRFPRNTNLTTGRLCQDCEEHCDEVIQLSPVLGSLDDLEDLRVKYLIDKDFRDYVDMYEDYKYYCNMELATPHQSPLKAQSEEVLFSPKTQAFMDDDNTSDGGIVWIQDPEAVELYCREVYNLKKPCYNLDPPVFELYAVITPYWDRKGMSMVEVDSMIRKRWSPKRYMITYEDRDKDGDPINPHYNVLISTCKQLKSYNNNNLNVEVRPVKQTRTLFQDYEVLVKYMFKTYYAPIRRPMYMSVHYCVWSKDYAFRLIN